ncbi:DUF7427 family protein [Nocardia flavorosea]|uniref:DUF7427 family protein n=1 Tax=Nocardia flavorosea TaxID=53429 RepID=UPI000AD5999E
MTRARLKAWHLWLVVIGVVVVADAIAPEGHTLSEGVDRALERRPLLTRVAIELVARHLTNDLPPHWDPIAALARTVS